MASEHACDKAIKNQKKECESMKLQYRNAIKDERTET